MRHWYVCPAFRNFPPVARAWVASCAQVKKTPAGRPRPRVRLFHLMRSYYQRFPYDRHNYLTIVASRDGFPFVVDLLDFDIYRHTVPLLYYGDAAFALFKSLLAPNTAFIDIGANHGMFALTAAHHLGRSVSVHAFEPQGRPRGALQRSVREGRLGSVTVHGLALGEDHTESELFVPDMGSGVGSLSQGHAAKANPETVVVKPLDAVAREQGIDAIGLVKVDVEGWEHQVFLGAKETLARHQPLIWFEANPSALRLTGRSTGDLFALLRSFGYSTFFDVAAMASGDRREILEVDGLKDILAVPEAKRGVLNDLKCGLSQGASA